MDRNAEIDDAPAFMAQDDEGVQHAEGSRGYREEVDRYEAVHVALQECAPGL